LKFSRNDYVSHATTHAKIGCLRTKGRGLEVMGEVVRSRGILIVR